MIFSARIYTPPNTAESSPLTTALQMSEGLVYRLEVHFPDGNCGNHGMRVMRGAVQLWPTTVGEYFVGSGTVIAFDDLYLLEQPPYQFEIETFNIDTTNQQEVSFYCGIVSRQLFKARFLPSLAWEEVLLSWRELTTVLTTKRDEVLPPIVPQIIL